MIIKFTKNFVNEDAVPRHNEKTAVTHGNAKLRITNQTEIIISKLKNGEMFFEFDLHNIKTELDKIKLYYLYDCGFFNQKLTIGEYDKLISDMCNYKLKEKVKISVKKADPNANVTIYYENSADEVPAFHPKFYSKFLRNILLPYTSRINIAIKENIIRFTLNVDYPWEYRPLEERGRTYGPQQQTEYDEKELEKFTGSLVKHSQHRVGQSLYARSLKTEFENKCPLSKCKHNLIASHLKPWSSCEEGSIERVDKNNGIPLTPTLDKYLDRGYITFNKEGKIILSPILYKEDKDIIHKMCINNSISKKYLTIKRLKYFDFHRKNIFQK